MIVFDLQCAAGCGAFEAWFRSSADYDEQRSGGLVQCPVCQSAEIDKAPMAPRVGAKGNQGADIPPEAVKAAQGEGNG